MRRWLEFVASVVARFLGVPPVLVQAVVDVESQWNPTVIGDAGKSFGLMQVQQPAAFDAVGERVSEAVLLNPVANLIVGTLFLRQKLARWGFPDGVAAYNAGTPRRRADGTFINQNYVDAVLRAAAARGGT